MSMTICPRANQRAVAAPGANTNILTTSITALMSCRMRVWITLATASAFNYTENDGSTTRTFGLNSSVPLSAANEYVFDHAATGGYAYNYQVATNGIITKIRVDEVYT